jgi:uncharacterized membrane protein
MPTSRNVSADVVRGLAIFLMIPANMAASVYAQPHAFWFRVVGSFAAPIFVMVAGMMVVIGAHARQHEWPYYLGRGALLVATGALIDVTIYRYVPFYSFDVLYLIGIACPLAYLFARLPRIWQCMLIALVVLSTPLLQWTFGYTDYPGDFFLWGGRAGTRDMVPEQPTGLVQHLLIDGWFPIFPWLGISFAGVAAAQSFLLSTTEAGNRAMGLAAMVLVAVGVAAWLAYPGPMLERNGSSELFYPPTVGFVITACGAVLALLWTVRRAPEWPLYAPLRWLGECALLMYVLHLVIIVYVLEPLFPEKGLREFLAINFATVSALVLVAAAVRKTKQLWPDRPAALRFLFGG